MTGKYLEPSRSESPHTLSCCNLYQCVTRAQKQFWGLAIVETLQIYDPGSPRNIHQILIYILLTFWDSLRKTKNKDTKLRKTNKKLVIAIRSLQFKYRIAALNTLTLHPFLTSLPACHSQESQGKNPEAKYLYNMRTTSACAPCHTRGTSRGSCQGFQDTKCLCVHFCATRHTAVASCCVLLHNQKEPKAPSPATSCNQNPQCCCTFCCFSCPKLC